MIDWRAVAANALWIVGLSGLLATFSYGLWLAQVTGRRRADVFVQRSIRSACRAALLLVLSGWAVAQASRRWEQAILLIAAAWLSWDLISAITAGRDDEAGPDAGDVAGP